MQVVAESNFSSLQIYGFAVLLSDRDIRAQIESKRVGVEPFAE